MKTILLTIAVLLSTSVASAKVYHPIEIPLFADDDHSPCSGKVKTWSVRYAVENLGVDHQSVNAGITVMRLGKVKAFYRTVVTDKAGNERDIFIKIDPIDTCKIFFVRETTDED